MCELYVTIPVKILRFKVLVIIFIQVIVWLHSYSINAFVFLVQEELRWGID